MPEDLLHVDGVTVTYRRPGQPPLTALDDVSLRLQSGQVLGIVGESGSGKSTLAKAICGLVPLDGGTIRFCGDEVKPMRMRRRPQRLLPIQMVFQNPYASLNPRRSVGSAIHDGLRLSNQAKQWTVPELLHEVGLDPSVASRSPHEFSGGQRQRIAIARAMAAGPSLLIGDEPIASLDASLQSRIAGLMRDLAVKTGMGLLFISHDLAVVREIVDTVVVMHLGRIVEQGPVSQVWHNPQHQYTQKLIAAIPSVDGLRKLPGLSPSETAPPPLADMNERHARQEPQQEARARDRNMAPLRHGLR